MATSSTLIGLNTEESLLQKFLLDSPLLSALLLEKYLPHPKKDILLIPVAQVTQITIGTDFYQNLLFRLWWRPDLGNGEYSCLLRQNHTDN